MEPEGVVHALRNVHYALVPGGAVLDLHSVPPAGPVLADGAELGRVDFSEFFANLVEVERRVDEAVADGVFLADGEVAFAMREQFDDGPSFFGAASEWAGARLPPVLVQHALTVTRPVEVVHNMVVRKYRAVG